ncbi:chaperonin GroEL [Candidatus Wolfebacteria bacterium]|nr:chaperonin GroEL [Candidatus Wolfebacteria bacterium]
MPKEIFFNEKARTSIKKGVDILADAVRMTLGPRGRAVVIEKSYGAPQVTLDGVTVAKEIELEDKFENLGADLIKQAADKTNDNVGDGTTTSVVLARAIIDEGEKAIREKGFNVIRLSKELEKASEMVVEGLEKQKETIDKDKIKEVATLSAKHDEIGELIAKVMEKIGRDGVVTIEDSNTIANSYEMVEGMQFDRGYISPYMVTSPERMEAALNNPYILVTDKRISSIQELLPLLEKVVQSGKKEIVIIAEDIDGEALATLVVNKIRGTFNVLAIKAPGFGDRKKEMLEDICVVTGASLISDEIGKKLDAVELSELGKAHRVVSTKDHTTIVDGKGAKEDIDERVNQLKSQLKEVKNDFDKEKLQERLGKLAGGVAVIKVGAPTESAQKELKQRVEDAVAATRAAMEEGIVPGGGIALYNVMKSLGGKNDYENESEAVKVLLKRALEAPVTAIVENSGEDVSKVMKELASKKGDWEGFNAHTNKLDDLKKAGIIDPLKVTKTAFLNAVSVASTYLTIGVAITNKPEPKDKQGGMPSGMGMPGMM